MRAFDDNDAFPATDYGLKQEIKRHPEMCTPMARLRCRDSLETFCGNERTLLRSA
jgi:3-methyladenine DNA glycosylase/8-oxoguanine DNA glycosylase